MFRRLCASLQRMDLMEHPDFCSESLRSENRVALNAILSAITRTRTRAEWIALFEKDSVAAGPINSIDEVFADPQVQHLGIAQPLHHPRLGDVEVVGQPFILNRTPSQMRTVAPDRGAHNHDILSDIGYSPEQITALKEKGVL